MKNKIIRIFVVLAAMLPLWAEAESVWVPSAYWEAPMQWLQKESTKSGIEMRALMLPTNMSGVDEFLKMTHGEPMAVSFYEDFKINDVVAPTCVIGRNSLVAWGEWLSFIGPGKEDWARFWLVAHEWAHCLDMREGGLKAESSFRDKQMSERRSDVFASLVLSYMTKTNDWYGSLARQRVLNDKKDLHDTVEVLNYMVKMKPQPGDGVLAWWGQAKKITAEVYGNE